MASYVIPHQILRLLFRTSHVRPFSISASQLLPEPQTHTSASSTISPPPSSTSKPRPVQDLANLLSSYTNPTKPPDSTPPLDRTSLLASTKSLYRAADLERYSHRRFRAGDVYAPHDLSPTEQSKWRPRRNVSRNISLLSSRKSIRRDAFDVLGVHPLAEFKNFAMMTEFVSSMGRIKHRRETGLRGVNQRRVARAVRRAVGMGLLPSVHKHPEMLEKEAMQLTQSRSAVGGGYRASRNR
ncbi:MAG: hypothetical protein LQ343_003718 [Gyalolechia ehrenbergii]|nr:MAG: hypothetical protein LQ343_003718 [Gyalolechia ehrenbergii]